MTACPKPRLDPEPIVFRIVATPAGWRIVGVDSLTMSTLYLSQELAVGHAREMAEVMRGHGQLTTVVIEGETPKD
jgi:hypothetical protein